MGQITRQCLTLTLMLLDFFHLSEHVNQGKRATFGDDSDEGKQWAGEVLHTVKHEGFAPFWERLLKWRVGQRSGYKRKEADGLLHYVGGHRKMIRYEQSKSRGWRISCSPTESECGAVPDRVKGSGKRWDSDNAEAVMTLDDVPKPSDRRLLGKRRVRRQLRPPGKMVTPHAGQLRSWPVFYSGLC